MKLYFLTRFSIYIPERKTRKCDEGSAKTDTTRWRPYAFRTGDEPACFLGRCDRKKIYDESLFSFAQHYRPNFIFDAKKSYLYCILVAQCRYCN